MVKFVFMFLFNLLWLKAMPAVSLLFLGEMEKLHSLWIKIERTRMCALLCRKRNFKSIKKPEWRRRYWYHWGKELDLTGSELKAQRKLPKTMIRLCWNRLPHTRLTLLSYTIFLLIITSQVCAMMTDELLAMPPSWLTRSCSDSVL